MCTGIHTIYANTAFRIIIFILLVLKAFRLAHDLPEEMTPAEIGGDNAEHYMSQLCIFASTHIFPYNFTVNLERPPNSTSNRCVTPKTLQNYLGKVLKDLRALSPDHEDWINLKKEEVPDWWTAIACRIFKCVHCISIN